LLIVGERLNVSRKGMEALVRGRDEAAIRAEAIRQVQHGADMLDVNAGALVGEEPEALRWLVATVQSAVDVPVCIDSPNPAAIASALEVVRGKPLVNSISGEEARFRGLIGLVKERGCGVVALCVDDEGVPASAEESVAKGSRLVERLLGSGVPPGDIFVDPVVRPAGTDSGAGVSALEAVKDIKRRHPGIRAICGLSNFSFGLPHRSLLNRTFLVAMMSAGLDAAILDPVDDRLHAVIKAAEVVLGRDRNCARYVKAYRDGKLGSA